MNSLPKIKPNVLVARAGNELLVHVKNETSAHCLSDVAVKIFLACRDQTSRELLLKQFSVRARRGCQDVVVSNSLEF